MKEKKITTTCPNSSVSLGQRCQDQCTVISRDDEMHTETQCTSYFCVLAP